MNIIIVSGECSLCIDLSQWKSLDIQKGHPSRCPFKLAVIDIAGNRSFHPFFLDIVSIVSKEAGSLKIHSVEEIYPSLD